MYKTFIVEDEHLIRDSLRTQIMKLSQQYNISYAGEASDGEMALASIIELQPDIIISDIKMPFMDGISFAKEARKILPWCRIIFISGFDDFEYAKGAIQVQADNYLLKPIKNEELTKTIIEAIKNLDLAKQNQQIKSESSLFSDIQKSNFLDELFKNELTVPETLEKADNLFQRQLAGKNYTVLLANNHYNNSLADYTQFSKYLNYLFITNPNTIFSSMSSNYIKFLVFANNRVSTLETSYQIANTLIHELDRNIIGNIAVGIGPVVERLSDISFSFENAQNLLSTYGNVRTEKIISFEDDMKEGELSPTHPFKMDLAKEITELSTKNHDYLIQRLMQTQGSHERTRMFRFFILTELRGLIQRRGDFDESYSAELTNLNDLISIANNNEEYQDILVSAINYLRKTKIQPSMSKYQSVINQAINYINANYTDPDISLNSVAAVVSLSPAHFSTIFSQSLNQTFIEYLTEQRIKYAKMLLTNSNKRLAEIALDIGYNDPNYFSFLFKKKQGISPTEYRQKFMN
ncbi:response regulator transcription factor [Lapidilactobacillus wuchangensis]|uniref:response regulator transcription factor n=1 Tax=Lapidilactobacillus wuchangensis TaxID=2486001 RepID=UPI000F777737|nr:response regulator [Lapidilactobacillus wuchangensis]